MRKVVRFLTIFSALIAVFGLSNTANAVPVVFNRATADLSITGSTTNPDGSTTYTVVFTFDFTSWDASSCVDSDGDDMDSCGAENATNLGAIDFSFGGPENPEDVLISTTADGNWETFDEVANANGCDGGGHNSICAEVGNPSLVAIGGTYEWVFHVTFEDYVPDIQDAAVRASFAECFDFNECGGAGLMSLRTTNVPEPATLGMLGTSLLLLGFSRRRRKVQLDRG